MTTSLNQSKYTAGDGIKRNTRYNGSYVFNLLGGQRYTPIDLQASREAGHTVWKQELAWTEQ